ncbi:MAG: rod shape-determining protein [Armatimonadota bacterium]
MFGWKIELGMDLGSCTTRIYQRGVGILLSEPTAIAFSPERRDVLAIGSEAKAMADQLTSEARSIAPVRFGVLADHLAAAQMAKEMIRRALGRRTLFMPRVVAGVAAAATPVERAALHAAIHAAGARTVQLVDRTLAAAIGAGVATPSDRTSRLVVSLGGGITEFGVVSQGRVVWARNLRFGGRDLDEAIRKMMRNRYDVSIAAATAEQMKLQVGAVIPSMARSRVLIGGGEVYGELFRNLQITLDGIPDLLARTLAPIINEIHWSIAEASPEQRAEIKANGILLTGGTALLQGIPQLMRERLGVPVIRAREPAHSVILGLGAILQDQTKLSRDGMRYG